MPVRYKPRTKKDPYEKFAKQISETTIPIIEKFFKRKNIVFDYTNVDTGCSGIMEIKLVFRENILPKIKSN